MFRCAACWKSAVSLLLALGLSACAGASDMGDDDDGGAGPIPVIDSATVLTFANAANDLVGITLHTVYSDQELATPNPFLLPNFVAGPARVTGVMASAAQRMVRFSTNCVPVTTGVDTLGHAIDSDGDGYPDDFTVDYGAGCTQIDSTGIAFTFSGRYELKDTGNGVLDFSYTPTELAAMARDTTTGHFFRQRVTSVESAHFTPSHAAHQMNVTREITTWSGGDTVHVLIHTILASTFDPAVGSAFSNGGRLPAGTLDLAGELTFRDIGAGADSVRFVYSTPTPIHLSFACDTGIDAGELLGLFLGDERVGFRFTWPGCVAPGLQLFGVTG